MPPQQTNITSETEVDAAGGGLNLSIVSAKNAMDAALVARLIGNDPALHSSAGERDPDKIRRRVVDGLRKLGFVRFSPRAKWRTDRTDDVDVRLELNCRLFKSFQNFFRVAKEKMSPRPRRSFQDVLHEIWAINAIR